MSIYALISSILSYVFTTIIYLFIFGVIALIYMDIKKTNRGEEEIADLGEGFEEIDESDDDFDEEQLTVKYVAPYARLRTIKSKEASESKMKASYRIDKKGAIVGRGKTCDISIQDMYLSVEHFQIWYEDGIWYIGDMGSKNGTFLNEIRVKKVKTLHDGDEIAFGGLRVIFEEH